MTFDFFGNIAFYFVLIGLLILSILLLYIYLKRKYGNPSGEFQGKLLKLNEEKKDFESEIIRLKYILNDYKKKLFNLSGEAYNINKPNELNTDKKDYRKNESDNQLRELISEKENLEIEKQKFQAKNKKLWEQSIAIHKEKERIDALKVDIELRHKEVTASIRYAKRIQSALLPSNEMLKNVLPNHFIYWKPRNIVSGDFYWAKKINEYVTIAAVDCTGHGVPGAFMSMLGMTFMNETVKSEKPVANIILENLRKKVKSSLSQTGSFAEPKDGMDMALCVINTEHKTLQYSGAYNPLLLVRENKVRNFKAVRNPIGIYKKEKSFVNTEIEILENDVFYIFSDGFIDQFGGVKSRKFGIKNFYDLLINLNSENIPLSKQVDMFDNTFEEWISHPDSTGTYFKQIDDILIIGFQI